LITLLLEVTLRIFGLAANTMPTQNVDDYVFVPGEKGCWVRGGLGEITNYYEINKQGYNSIVDFEHLDDTTINIALVGDSYIQGFQTDVRNSIGRQLENILGANVRVHEYGRAGANIVDFSLVYNEYIKKNNYDFTFVLATDKDLMEFKASYMDRGNRVPKETLSRKIYGNVHIFRYLNINHGFGVHFNDLINNGPESIERIHVTQIKKLDSNQDSFLEDINVEAINALPETVVFLYEDDKLNQQFIENFDFEFKEVIHHKQPKDHGFDGHWNANGRYNCAMVMAEFLREKF
jgi:hypothetical protein